MNATRGEAQGIPPYRPWNLLAFVAAGLGILALWLWVLAPVPLVLGYLAIRAINDTDGQQRGIRVAWAGLILGGGGCVLLVFGLLGIVLASLQPPHARTWDADHLRKIGIAFTVYHDRNKKRYPPAVAPTGPLPPEERLSWLVLQLPYLEQRKDGQGKYADLAVSLDLDQGYAAKVNAGVRTPLRVYQSPVAPANPDVPDFTSYAGIAGVGVAAATLPASAPDAGFFGYARTITDADLKAGVEYTLAVTETTQGGSWGRGGPGTAFGIPAQGDTLVGRDRSFGGLYPDGFHLLFADGHVSFSNPEFPPGLLRELARINRPSE